MTTDLSAEDDAAMFAQMSELDVISLSVFPPEPQPIPLDACVKECQKVSAEFHAAMKRLGVESE